MTIYVLHENDEWIGPFAAALDATGLPWEPWFLAGGTLDLDRTPPEGVFWSRMSASSHTRGHELAKDHTRAVLSWLESHGRRVVNGRRVLELEMSKVDQLTALRAAGIATPQTVAVVGTSRLVAEAKSFTAPFITKHDQGGKGLGVMRFDDANALERWLGSGDAEEPANGIWLLQELVVAPQPRITRVEIVDGALVYALDADTSGGFELCPADACAIDDLACPVGEEPASLFTYRPDIEGDPLVDDYIAFARRWGIEIAAFEFIESTDGRRLTYDINTNTNYNPDVEAIAPRSGPAAIAEFLGRLHAEAIGDHTGR